MPEGRVRLRGRGRLLLDRRAVAARELRHGVAHFRAGAVGQADELLVQAIPGLRDPLAYAQATRLRGRIQYACGEVGEATGLVEASPAAVPWQIAQCWP